MVASTNGKSAPPRRWLPASLVSFAVHASAILVLVAAIERAPLGGTDQMGGTMNIVLNHTAAPAVLPSDESTPDSPAAVAEITSAPTAQAVAPAAESTSVEPPATTNSSDNGSTHADNLQAELVQGGSYGPPGDGQTQVRVFGVQGVGQKFVYVFDRSTSMEGPPLAAAKQQLMQSLESLGNLHQFHIIFFNQQIRSFSIPGAGRRIAFATAQNKLLAGKFIGGITADGGTERLPALRAAIAMQPDVIFFLTDAVDRMPESELAEIERLNRRAGATICTIEVGIGPQPSSSNFLMQLAQMTGGQYGYVDTLRLTH